MQPVKQDELSSQIRKIITSPIRSQISTADIAVGMWSSSDLGEKVFDLEALITTQLNSLLDWVEAELPQPVHVVEIIDFPESRLFAEAYSKGEAAGFNKVVDTMRQAIAAKRQELNTKGESK